MEKRLNLFVQSGLVEGKGRKQHFVSVLPELSGMMGNGAPIDGTRYDVAFEYAKAHGMAYRNTRGVWNGYDAESVARVAPHLFRCDKDGAPRRTESGKLSPITYDFKGYYKKYILPIMVDYVHADYTRRCGANARYDAAVVVSNGLETRGAVTNKKRRTTKRRGGRKH